MKRAILSVMVLLTLAGCGSGSSSPAGIAPIAPPPPVVVPASSSKVVTSAAVIADYRQGDPSGEYLADVTLRTSAGEEIALEYCDTRIEPGDRVDLVPYQVGTVLVFVNEVLVGSVIDRPATEAQIANPDPEKERQVAAAWEQWETAHYAGEVDQ